MTDFTQKLKQFLHDPIDKCFDIKTHKQRAKEYADILKVLGFDETKGSDWIASPVKTIKIKQMKSFDETKGSDWIASCMERSLLPKGIKQPLTEIRHPLSETKIDVTEMNIEEIKNFVAEIYKELADKISNEEDKIKFLFIWRNLLGIIAEKSKEKPFRKFWSVIPADTRIPDHSIWEHLKIASAVNAFWDEENKQLYQDNSLFLFSIGPVQSFISQARKTQDLFMGSFLLSYLTFIAIEKVIEDLGPTAIIFPDLYSQPLMDWYLEHKAKIKVENSFADFVQYPTIPNRFVAIIPKTEIEKIDKELEATVRNEWEKIVNQILDAFEIKLNEDTIKRQILDFPQIYWVVVPWKIGNEDIKPENLNCFTNTGEIDKWNRLWEFATKNCAYPPNIGFLYQLLYTSLEKSMGMRKNLRNFEQSSEPGKKCSICGEKEALIENGTDNLTIGKFISDKERLCIICFTKRGLEKYLIEKFGSIFEDFNFPSTAEVALSDFKKKALDKANDEFKKYVEKFDELTKDKDKFSRVNPLPALKESFNGIENLEGEWFFEENLTEKAIKKYLGVEIQKEKIDELKKYLKQITNKIGNPNPYYTVIMVDADDMGRWLSGEMLPLIEYAYNSETWKNLPDDFKGSLKELTSDSKKIPTHKILTPAIHASISNALRNYSIEFVRKIVEEEHLGKLVYAGGDDVLAFVNLKDLFEVMRKLRGAFSGYIKIRDDGGIEVDWQNNTGFVEKDGKYLLTMGPKATASCGVVIAHYKMPLKLVLDKVREMEKEAKDAYGKDAFAIALIKHSGQVKKFVCKWRFEKDSKKIDTIEKMKEICEFFIGKDEIKLSKTFIQKIYNEFIRLKDKKGRFTGPGSIFDTELKRLLKRSLEGGKEEERKAKAEILAEILSNLFWYSDIGSNLDRFANLLETISFISKPEE